MNDEAMLEQKFGKQNPFRVPDGYFSDFEKKLLENISAPKPVRKPLIYRLKPWAWAAGTAAAVVFGVVFYMGKSASVVSDSQTSSRITVAGTHDNTDYLIEEVSDYAMLDNGDIYSYVAGE